MGFARGVPLGIEGYGDSYTNDMSATKLYCDCAEDMELYRIEIAVPALDLPAGVATERNVKFIYIPVGSVYGYSDARYGTVYSTGPGSDDFVSNYADTIVGTHYDFEIAAKSKLALTVGEGDDLSDGADVNVSVRMIEAGGQYSFCVVTGNKLFALSEREGCTGVYDCQNGYCYALAGLDKYKNYQYRPDTDDSVGYVAGVAMVISYKMIPEVIFMQVQG